MQSFATTTGDFSIDCLFGLVALSVCLFPPQLQLQRRKERRHAHSGYHWLDADTNLHIKTPIGWFDRQLKQNTHAHTHTQKKSPPPQKKP